MTGLSRAQVTRLITAISGTGRVKAAAYQRTGLPALHRGRCGLIGLRRQGARELERTGHPAHPGARIRQYHQAAYERLSASRWRTSTVCAIRQHIEAQHQLSTHAAHADSYRRTAQAAAAGSPDICASTPCIRAIRTAQRAVSYQCRGRGHPMGNCGRHLANLRTLAAASVGGYAGAISLRDSRFSLRQWQRVHQLQRRAAAGQTTHRTNPSHARIIPATTGWWRPRTAPLFASTSATATSMRSTPRRWISFTGDTSIRTSISIVLVAYPSPHRSQRQAPPSLPALGHPLRVVPGVPRCESSCGPRHAGRTGGFAQAQSDTEAALAMQRAKRKLFKSFQSACNA